jgi:hypothetical protein
MHEAGHVVGACYLDHWPESVELRPGPPLHGVTSVPLAQTEQIRRLIAVAGHAIERRLYDAGRLTNLAGQPISEVDFIQLSLARNAADDKPKFFGRPTPSVGWTMVDDGAFRDVAKGIADKISLEQVEVIAVALLQRCRLVRDDIVKLLSPFASS